MLLLKNIALASVQWLLLIIVRVALIIVGLPVVAIAALFPVQGVSVSDGRPIWNLPRWAWLFGNDHDGLDGDRRLWWAENCDAYVLFGLLPLLRRFGIASPPQLSVTSWLSRWWWAALRNPVNNLRLVAGFNCPVAECLITNWGNFIVEDKPGMGGIQFVMANRSGGSSRWFGFYWVHEWSATRAFVIRLGYKIKPEHSLKEGEPGKGMTFKANPFKAI